MLMQKKDYIWDGEKASTHDVCIYSLCPTLCNHANLEVFLNLRKKCRHVTHCCGSGPSQPSSVHSGSQGPKMVDNLKIQAQQAISIGLFCALAITFLITFCKYRRKYTKLPSKKSVFGHDSPSYPSGRSLSMEGSADRAR